MSRALLLVAPLVVLACNEPPQAGSLTLTPSPATTTDELVAVFDEPVTDEDGDELTLTWTWRRDGEVVGDLTTDRVPADRTARDEAWTAEVVAMDKRTESEVMSASITVQNTPPTLELTLPETATTTEALTVEVDAADADEDEIDLTWTWTVDGTTTTFDGPTVPAAETRKGQVWEVEVTSADQDGPGAVERATVSIVNSAPALTGAEVGPEELREATVATCTPLGWTDADGDSEGANITWLVDGAEVATGAELTGEHFDKGQSVACRVEPDDGEDVGEPVLSESVVVLNTAPVITSATLPSPVRTEDTVELAASEVVDDDGDEVTIAYAWTVDGAAAGTEPTLPAEAHAKGDEIGLTLVPSDEEEAGPAFVVDPITVANTPPVVVSARIEPGTAYTNDILEVTSFVEDADDDPDLTVTVSWLVNGTAVSTGPTLDGATAFDKGDTVVAEVTPSDGEDAGVALSTVGLTISNSPPTAPEVIVDPAFPTVGEALECLIDVDAIDADGDSLTYTASWTVDGVASTAATTTDFTDDTIPAETTADEEEWTCSVTASDGTDTSPAGTETVTVLEWVGKRTFTNCSATGQSGPTQSACDTAYTRTTLDGEVTVSGGKQSWTVPLDGTYRIEAWGAQGASAEPGRTGGRGARMRGDFALSEGDVLTIIVGQTGTVNSCHGGGGGASAVDRGSTPLVVAGGGGGTRAAVLQNGCDANTAAMAGTGSRHNDTHGCGLKSSSTIGDGGIVSSSSWGSGGGSIVRDGEGEYDVANGGRSLRGTALGGGTTSYRAYGGFGGGGAGNGRCGGGGGGGYSGGDGGRLAGAGGAYNGGSSQSNSAGARSGMGLVTIDLL